MNRSVSESGMNVVESCRRSFLKGDKHLTPCSPPEVTPPNRALLPVEVEILSNFLNGNQ